MCVCVCVVFMYMCVLWSVPTTLYCFAICSTSLSTPHQPLSNSQLFYYLVVVQGTIPQLWLEVHTTICFYSLHTHSLFVSDYGTNCYQVNYSCSLTYSVPLCHVRHVTCVHVVAQLPLLCVYCPATEVSNPPARGKGEGEGTHGAAMERRGSSSRKDIPMVSRLKCRCTAPSCMYIHVHSSPSNKLN